MKGIINPYIQSETAFDEYTAWLQSRGDIWKVTDNVYMATSYTLVKEALADEATFAPNPIERKVENAIRDTNNEELKVTQEFLKSWMAWLRGEEHSQWKKTLLQNFHSLNDLEALVIRTSSEAVNNFFAKDAEERDLVKELIDPFISSIILRTLNYDETTPVDIRAWSVQIRQILDPVWSGNTVQNVNRGLVELTDTLMGESVLGPNFLEKSFKQLNLKERNFLYGNLQFFVVAGIETSIYFFARAILILLETGLYKSIDWNNPREVKVVSEELIRYISPAVFVQRETTRDTFLGNQPIPEGSVMLLNINAANRDATVFSNPFELDFARPHYNHIAFGYKKHICFGKALSLLEINNFLPVFFKELGRYEAVEVVHTQYEKITLLRGLQSLRVKLCP